MTSDRARYTSTKPGAVKTIYRECECGENAHDFRLVAGETGGRWAYVCRNCYSPIYCKKAERK